LERQKRRATKVDQVVAVDRLRTALPETLEMKRRRDARGREWK
jgi:hypothetical protein